MLTLTEDLTKEMRVASFVHCTLVSDFILFCTANTHEALTTIPAVARILVFGPWFPLFFFPEQTLIPFEEVTASLYKQIVELIGK